VGASASGKTRVLNILFNIGRSATQANTTTGQWTIHFQHADIDYTWKFDSALTEDPDHRLLSESLWMGTPDNTVTPLISRSQTSLKAGTQDVPKLPTTSSAIYVLREDDSIKPVYEAFSRIMRRRFWSEDLAESLKLVSIPRHAIRRLDRHRDPATLSQLSLPLSCELYLLDRYFRPTLELIREQFKRVFPFVDDLVVGTAAEGLDMPLGSDVPLALVKERGIRKPVPLPEIASGMQKVLLIITDVITSPPDVLYMIDEYENSLGVNAIDFLPSFLADHGGNRQIVVTTHHPLLINAIPLSDWFVCHRKGMEIKVTPGHELESRYGRSKQQRFTQLINDPLYTEGIE
jgi:AAA domain, putative AbiEii toxin, Type IV TA system